MDFQELQARLVAALKARLHNGELTERRLARLAGISQPHMHNVLKGARILSPDAADRVLKCLRLSVLDLITVPELHQAGCPQCPKHGAYRGVPILEGWLGPGLPLPTATGPEYRCPFPTLLVTSLTDPVVARLTADARMTAVVRHNDLVLLDRSHHSRSRLDGEGLYVVNRHGEGLIRRLRMEGRRVFLGTEAGLGRPCEWEEIVLENSHVMDIVRARVVWIGRYLLSF